jgi:hypothetical protein
MNESPGSRRFAQDERGVTVILLALSLTALLAVIAFAVDLGYARQSVRNNQAVGDAASLAAARDLPTGAANPVRAQVARLKAIEFAANSVGEPVPTPACSGNTCTAGTGEYTFVVTTPFDGSSVGSSVPPHRLVRVEICRANPQFFGQFAGGTPDEVCRVSVARFEEVQPGIGIGILSLHPTAECAMRINGNNVVTVTGGAVLANSDDDNAVCGSSPNGGGNFTLNADLVSVVGGIGMPAQERINATVVEGTDPVPDPFADLPDSPCHAPAIASCDPITLRPITTGTCTTTAMTPGRFATRCDLGGNGTTNLLPGVYWFEAGLDPGNRDLRCPTCSAAAGGVLMYFNGGTLSHSGNGTVDLLPYQQSQLLLTGRQGTVADRYVGMSVYQRRGNATAMTVGGTTGSGLGTIYAAGARINMHGTVDRVVDGIIIGRTLDFQGTTTTRVNPPPGGPRTDPVRLAALEY